MDSHSPLKIENSQTIYPLDFEADTRYICMHRSRLESYEAILRALTKTALGIDRLAYRTSMDCRILHEYLAFLKANGVVEEQEFRDKTLFAITDRGVKVFKTLDFQKHLKRLSKTLIAANETIVDLPLVPKRRQKPP